MAIRDTYEVQTWEDLPSENTPISGERLSHIEQGIKNAMDNRALKEIYGDSNLGLGTPNGASKGFFSLAHGAGSEASGQSSFSSGEYAKAKKTASHAEGNRTIASSYAQHVQGTFNIEDANGIYAHIVGGGTSDANRKNIHTLDWQGNAMYAGTVESQGLILTDQATEQKYKLTVENGNIAITAVE